MARKTGSNDGTEEPGKRGKVEETELDEDLVNEAVEFIREAVRKTMERGFLEIGEFLFTKFFGGDPDQVRSKSPYKCELPVAVPLRHRRAAPPHC